MLGQLKNTARKLLLRGVVRDWWVLRRGRQLDRAYLNALKQEDAGSAPPPRATTSTANAPLRRILFIADCMWELNDLVPELQRIAEVSVLDLRPALSSDPGSGTGPEVVLSTIRDYAAQSLPEPDVVFLYARPGLLSEEVFEVVRKRWHCPLLGMSLDDRVEFFDHGVFSEPRDGYAHWARRFDLNLTNCLAATDWYRRRGLPCLYVPQGMHVPSGLTEPLSSKFKYELTFLGSIKPERKAVIDRLTAEGLPIQLFGTGWPNSQWVDSPAAVFRNTQVNLGIGFASPSLTLTTVKGRDFECPGTGACYLTTYNWELAQQYEVGKEILCYRSLEELIEIFGYYRKRPEACLALARAAWRRCAAEHTWERRFRSVFNEIGFRAP